MIVRKRNCEVRPVSLPPLVWDNFANSACRLVVVLAGVSAPLVLMLVLILVFFLLHPSLLHRITREYIGERLVKLRIFDN